MPSVAEITDTLVERAIEKGVAEVLTTMANETVALTGRTPNPPLHSHPEHIPGPHLVASVGFVGDINGLINTHLDDSLAVDIAAAMLGMTAAEASDNSVLSDAMGELTILIVGVFKNTLGDAGFVCKLTLPSIVRGTDFRVDHAVKNANRYIYNFRCRGRALTTDIIIQRE